MSADDQIDILAGLVKKLSDQGKHEFLAKLFVRLQLEYVELAKLSTDGEYVTGDWTHEETMNFLTRGMR